MPLFTGFRHAPGSSKEAGGTVAPAPEPVPAENTAAPAEPEAAVTGDHVAPVASDDHTAPEDRSGKAAWVRVLGAVATVLAAVLVLFALLLPNLVSRLEPRAFTRLPVEAILGAALLLALRPKARRIAALLLGTGLGVLIIIKLLDMGFFAVLGRPFDLVLDWTLLDDAESFLKDSAGPLGATGAVIGVVLLVLGVPAVTTLAMVRLSGLMARHETATLRTAGALAVAWITCTALGVQIAGVPVAARGTIGLVHAKVHAVDEGLKDERLFAKRAAQDAFHDTPPDRLLTGLRGKDVVFAFIESYGRSAVQDPDLAPPVEALLADGTRRLQAAGFTSRSAFLTSSTYGGGSWLAHSTFLTGLWIKDQRRYRTVTSSDRLTLTGAFRRTGAWRTVGVVPGVTRTWPEGRFYGLDTVYDSRSLGYKGPKFSWSPVPDQYTLSAFHRLEHARQRQPDATPLLAEIILTSSHNPWAPLPTMTDWDRIGDGSIYHAMRAAGRDPKEVWRNSGQIRTEYRRSVEYSLNSLISYVEKYGDDDTVLVFLGDHQPVPAVTGDGASRDVPITIVARDQAVLDRISGWGWDTGLKPGPKAPVWRMDTFRDRFLTAYGPRIATAPSGERPPSRPVNDHRPIL